jgi:hypothetical protein
MVINFESMEDVAADLFALAAVLDEPEQLAKFARRYVPRHATPVADRDRDEMRKLFAELEEMERQHEAAKAKARAQG